MTRLVHAVKRAIVETPSPFSLFPKKDYTKNVPRSANELMRSNWQRTGKNLHSAMKKVKDEAEKQK